MRILKVAVQPIVDREFRLWQEQNKSVQTVAKSWVKMTTHPEHAPFITVSREPGSGGKLIARLLAKKLGYEFYDREILEKLKVEFKKEKQEINEVGLDFFDEKEIGGIDELVETIIFPNLITQNHFVKHLVRLITSLTLNGKCLILGRGANFFTDHKFGFHVRISAPLNFRVQKTIEFEKKSPAAALEWVKKVSRERRKFVEKFFSRQIDNSEFYDLILNREYYTIEECVSLILEAFKKKMKNRKATISELP